MMIKRFFQLFFLSLLFGQAITTSFASFDSLSETKLVPSDSDFDARFGRSVSLDGSRMAVAAPQAEADGVGGRGAVYIYDFNGTTWEQTAKLSASDGEDGDSFAFSVSLSGNRVAVGMADLGSSSWQGAVYIYDFDGTTWTQTHKLTASDGAPNDWFGWSISLKGNYLAVGTGIANAVYIFSFNENNWNQTQKLTVADGSGFGRSVSLNDDRLAIGSSRSNAVYVFTLSDGLWSQTQKLIASDGGGNDSFGSAVSLGDNRLVVGAYNATIGDNSGQGAIYVFDFSENGWSQTAKLSASDGAAGDEFGYSVSLSGNRLTVGANSADNNGKEDQGAAYVFDFYEGNWSQSQKLTASDGEGGDNFGKAISLSARYLVVGAHRAGSHQQGAVYIYSEGAASNAMLSTVTGAWYDENYNGMGFNMVETNSGLFAYFYGYKGGINGQAQWLMSEAPIAMPIEKGKAYTVNMVSGFVGNGGSFTSKPTSGSSGLQYWGTMTLTFNDCGSAVATLDGADGQLSQDLSRIVEVSDLNCVESMPSKKVPFKQISEQKISAPDGVQTNNFGGSISIDGNRLAVGAEGDDIGKGAVYIYEFDATKWVQTFKITRSDGKSFDHFGKSVSLDGDRLAVGSESGAQEVVYVFDLRNGVWTETTKLAASDGEANDRFGSSVSLYGNRLAVGAKGGDIDNKIDQGSVYVFDLNDGVWTETVKLTANDGLGNDYFGSVVSLDGHRLAVFSCRDQSVYVFDFKDTAWSQSAKLTLVKGVGWWTYRKLIDLDGDRLVVGVDTANIGHNTYQGAAYVFDLVGDDWVQSQKLTASDGIAHDGFGSTVSLDKDRLVVISRWAYIAESDSNQGAAYVFDLNGDTWVETAKLVASDGGCEYGSEAVALDGNHVAVGVPTRPGEIYMYEALSNTVSTVTGAWYDEDYNGMGFNMVETGSGLFTYFYGYKGGTDGEAQWLLSEESIPTPVEKGTSYTVDMASGFVGNGGTFTTKPTSGSSGLQHWGTMTLMFETCDTAVATLDGADGQVTHNISRIAAIPGLDCVE